MDFCNSLMEGCTLYIALQDLGLFILFLIFSIAGVYLIMVLRRLLSTLGMVDDILIRHGDEVGKTLALLQETLTHVNQVTLSLQEIAAATHNTVHALPEDITDTIIELRDAVETFAVYVKIGMDIVKGLLAKK